MLDRDEALGMLAAFDRGEDGETFGEDDEQTLRTFASSAATASARTLLAPGVPAATSRRLAFRPSA
jgi:GAF domain-containing protein